MAELREDASPEGVKDSLHVDLVVNDFVAAEQRRVAIIHNVGGDIKAEAFSDDVFELPSRVFSRAAGREVECSESTVYLAALADLWHGSVFAASTPHRDSSCPYGAGNALPFASYSGSRTDGASSNGSVSGI